METFYLRAAFLSGDVVAFDAPSFCLQLVESRRSLQMRTIERPLGGIRLKVEQRLARMSEGQKLCSESGYRCDSCTGGIPPLRSPNKDSGGETCRGRISSLLAIEN